MAITQRAEAEAVHEVTNEAKEDVKEIKSDAKRTANRLSLLKYHLLS
jgi:hypothetical protein